MIKPEFWDDEKLAKVPRDARLLFAGLWTYSDDYGVVKGNPVWLKSKIFPYDKIEAALFHGWLERLTQEGFISPFESNKEKYFYIRKFSFHQVINRPSQQRNPSPPGDVINGSLNIHGVLTDESESETEVETESETEIESESVVRYLNEKTGKKFSSKSKETIDHIKARIAEGHTIEDFKRVIDVKVAKWKGKSWKGQSGDVVQGDDLLRPSTLFRPTNFENYLNESMPGAKQDLPSKFDGLGEEV